MHPQLKRTGSPDNLRARACLLRSLALTGMLILATPLPTPAMAAPSATGEIAEKQADLKELRGKIAHLRKELDTNEDNRASAADRMRDSERSVARLEKEIADLSAQREQLQNHLKRLDSQSKDLGRTLEQQQASLEHLLSRQYMQGRPDAMQILLNGDNPNQLSRDLYYLSTIAQSRSELLGDIRRNLEHKKALAEDAKARKQELDKIEAQQLQRKSELEAERKKRQALLSELSHKVKNQRQEIGNLQRDEKQMSALVSRLSQIIAKQAAAAKIAEEARKKQAAEAQRKARAATTAPAPAPVPEKPQASVRDNQFEPAPNDGSFARQKGKLRLPVRGKLSGRFGSSREGGGSWRGVFIQAPPGQAVKAVARGKIVFSEWMRGFGNLVIVDHGDAYLSIYGNNETLHKRVGETVNGGDPIASTGNTGSNPDSGLYFEIRHQGQPIDPMSWASVK